MGRFVKGRVGVVAAACAALVAGCGRPKEDTVVGHIPWALASVSADARTIGIQHEAPHCTTHAGKPVVQETTSTVRVTISELQSDVGGGDFACTAEQRIEITPVTLRAPLGRRTLSQPGRRGEEAAGNVPDSPPAKECAQLTRLAEDAPAREVPWVARRLAICTAPLPSAVRRLPILRRAHTTADDLPSKLTAALQESQLVLRPSRARRLQPGADVWFIPGPTTSCVGRIFQGYAVTTDCEPTTAVARRGLYAPTVCVRRTPKQISLTGLVPSGVSRVRLTPTRGSARTVPVSGGVWSARVAYPVVITYAGARLKTDYAKRACS